MPSPHPRPCVRQDTGRADVSPISCACITRRVSEMHRSFSFFSFRKSRICPEIELSQLTDDERDSPLSFSTIVKIVYSTNNSYSYCQSQIFQI